MASKQGGKGKTSSPSRQASHKRGPARTEANKTRKMARHAKRQGLNKAQMAAASTIPDFPRPRLPRPAERVVFGQPLKAHLAGMPLHMVRVAGVLVEISLHRGDAEKAKAEAFSRLDFQHGILNPLRGTQSLVQKRKAN